MVFGDVLTSSPPPVHDYRHNKDGVVEDDQQDGAQQPGHSHERRRRSGRRVCRLNFCDEGNKYLS